jgi:hypothetical protein
MQRMTARRVLSGIGVPLTAEVAIVDLHRTPDFMIPGLQLTGGLILVGLAFVASRRGAAAPETDEPEDSNRAEVLDRLHRQTAAFKTDVESPHVGPPSADSHADRAPGHTVSEAPAAGTTPRLEAVEAAVPAGAIDATGPHAAAHALRLPAIMLLNVTGEADASAIEAAPPLGPKAEVLARLRDVLPDLEVDARGRARHEGPSHSVRLDIGPRDIVHTVVVEAEGETGLSIVRWIIESTGWRAFVPKRGRFVDADALGREAIDHHEA